MMDKKEYQTSLTAANGLIDRLRKENKARKNLSELQDRLLVCYRVGKHPGVILDKLDKSRKQVAKYDTEEELPMNEMREIMFRGKTLDDGQWVHGYLIGTDCIVGEVVEWTDEYFNTEFWYKVDPETVGQYTGLKDKNGKEIYEGDKIKGLKRGYDDDDWHRVEVYEHNGCFMFGVWNAHEFFNRFQYIEVIGNIHEDGGNKQ